MNRITLTELINWQQNNENLLELDVREPEEYEAQHIPNAINITLNQLEDNLLLLKEKLVVTVCGKGSGRSARAVEKLINQEIDAYSLDGSTVGWFENNSI